MTSSTLEQFFNKSTPLFSNEISYQDFWSLVLKIQIPENKKYIFIKCKAELSLAAIVHCIVHQKVAVLIDKNATNEQISEKLTYFNSQETLIFDDTFVSNQSVKFHSKTPVDSQKCCVIIFTSGTQSKPKPIMLSLSNLYHSAKASLFHYQLNSQDNWAMSLPFHHIGGLMIFFRTIFNGSTTTIFNPSFIAKELAHSPISLSVLSLVETQLLSILESKEAISCAKKLKGIVLGGMKTSLKTLQKCRDLDILVSNSYGATETSSQVFATPFTTNLDILESVGSPLGNTDFKINENSITITSNSIALGIYPDQYFNGVITNQDRANFNDNYLFIHGRSDEVIISGGKKISPQFLEKKYLDCYSDISFSKVVSCEDTKFSQVPALFIQTPNCYSYEKLKNDSADLLHLEKFEIPKIFVSTKYFNNNLESIKPPLAYLQELASDINKFFEILGRPTIRGNIFKDWLFVFHGFMGNSEDFLFLNESIEEDYLIFYINLPGHGPFNQQSFTGFDDYINTLSHALYETKTLKNKKLNLLGYSLGGRISTLLAQKFPCHRVILESSGLGIEDSERPNRQKRDQDLFAGINTQQEFSDFLKKWYTQALFLNIDKCPEYPELINRDFKLIPGFTHSLKIHGQAVMPKISVAPESFAAPSEIHYLYGELDESYKKFAKIFKEARHHTHLFEKTSHNIHSTNKNNYLEIVKSILLK